MKKSKEQPTLFAMPAKTTPKKNFDFAREAIRKKEYGDVEESKLLYLSNFQHKRCGGNPYAYVNGKVVCKKCSLVFSPLNGNEPLGKTLARSPFVRIT